MDVLLQTHEAKRVFPVPEGLKELSSDIIREVLRHQPECIHAFVAEYLETMLVVRDKARESAVVISDVFSESYFFDNLYRTKRVTKDEANMYATTIQAGWRGYVVRTKLRIYVQKKRKAEEEKELKKSLKVEEFLRSVGITYDEATRAACMIQAAYRQSRRDKCIVNQLGEEVRMEDEGVPIGQRIREGDRAHGRYDRWDKKDWGDFFTIDEQGEIEYHWPRVGQLWRILRKHVRPDMDVVQFFAMRDLQGKEQYSYLKEPQAGREPRGFPIGFLIPLLREFLLEESPEVGFVAQTNSIRMGCYTYIFQTSVDRQDLEQFIETILARESASKGKDSEAAGELEYDPDWVLPKIMVQIRKDCLRKEDDELYFFNESTAPQTNGVYTFRAETAQISLKVFNYMKDQKCKSIEDAMKDAANLTEYMERGAGRFLPVDNFDSPKYIQKVIIIPETETGEYENDDMDNYEYVFVPRNYTWRMKMSQPENPITIPIARFQGYHSNYMGSCALEESVFIMGPMLHSPDGKPFTYESLFWDEFGLESWYQLLCKITNKKIARLSETEEQVEEEEVEVLQVSDEGEGEIEGETEEDARAAKEGRVDDMMAALPQEQQVDKAPTADLPEEEPVVQEMQPIETYAEPQDEPMTEDNQDNQPPVEAATEEDPTMTEVEEQPAEQQTTEQAQPQETETAEAENQS